MHPNAFLRSFWRTEVRNQVFVAMSFDSKYDKRYSDVIRPAIEQAPFGNLSLSAFRVDNAKTGDSILTTIVDEIAHSRLVLADVSTVDQGKFTGAGVRNGNVMYEVGLALACRSSAEVLLLRDDRERFLFDVSTIPHATLDFDAPTAQSVIRSLLIDRLSEVRRIDDVRAQVAARVVTSDEFNVLKLLSVIEPDASMDFTIELGGFKVVSAPDRAGLERLIAKGCIDLAGINSADGGTIHYRLNDFGRAVAEITKRRISDDPPNLGDWTKLPRP